MKVYQQAGKIMELVAPYDRLSGEGAKVGSMFGVAMDAVLSGATGEFLVVGVVTLKKNASSEAWAQGIKIYWDDSAKQCTSVSTSNLLIGHAFVVAGSTDATGLVRLHGAPS